MQFVFLCNFSLFAICIFLLLAICKNNNFHTLQNCKIRNFIFCNFSLLAILFLLQFYIYLQFAKISKINHFEIFIICNFVNHAKFSVCHFWKDTQNYPFWILKPCKIPKNVENTGVSQIKKSIFREKNSHFQFLGNTVDAWGAGSPAG